MAREKYWTGEVGEKDDFGNVIGDEFIDGKTREGPWALMSMESWKVHGVRILGVGYGQRYKKQANGRWLKVGG